MNDHGRAAPLVGHRAVVCASVIPVRAEPTHRSELTSQWILGETLVVEAVEGSWLCGRGTDGYTGWTPASPFRHAAFGADEWLAAATLRSLGVSLQGAAAQPDRGVGRLGRLPWGARMKPCEGEEGLVVLPDGRSAAPTPGDRIISAPTTSREIAGMTPAELTARVLRHAADWTGVPYLWGGRTELGVDCSGFVQAVFAALGFALPRDSHRQFEALTQGAGSVPDTAPPAGDLVFFAPEGGAVTHVALSLGGWAIIHASASNGRVQTDDLDGSDPVSRLLAGSIRGFGRPELG